MSTFPAIHHVRLPRRRVKAIAAMLFRLRPPIPTASEQVKNAIEVVCISDTHNLRPTLPHGDILILAGDMTEWGTFTEVQAQLDWMSAQPHTHKVLVAGNHDLLFDAAFLDTHPEHKEKNSGRTVDDLDVGGVHYLQDQSITLRFPAKGGRQIRVYGSPWTPRYGSSAFQCAKDVDKWTGRVPLDTDILVSHGPPAGHLDGGRNAGCAYLLDELQRVRPRLIVFGHIHVARGRETVLFDKAQVLYEDVISGRRGWEAIPLLGFAILCSQARRIVRSGSRGSTELINATVVDGMKKDVALPAFVAVL